MKKNNLFTIFLILLGHILFAQDTFTPIIDVDTFTKDLEKASKKNQSITSDFIQERNMEALSQVIVSKGAFWYKKPAFIRWEYKEPYAHLIVISKNKVQIKDDNSNKEYDTESNKIFKDLGDIMLGFITGNLSKSNEAYNAEYSENSKLFYVKLLSKNESKHNVLAQIDLFFDKKDYSLHQIIMHDKSGDKTSLTFTNKRLNDKIPQHIFKL